MRIFYFVDISPQFYLRMECINTSFSLDKQYISGICKQTELSVINVRDRLKLQITVAQWLLKDIISVLSFNFGVWTFTHNGIGHENEHILHSETAKLSIHKSVLLL